MLSLPTLSSYSSFLKTKKCILRDPGYVLVIVYDVFFGGIVGFLLCSPNNLPQVSLDYDMGVSKNRGGPPKSSILIVVSMIFTIHFGVFTPIFGLTPMCSCSKMERWFRVGRI